MTIQTVNSVSNYVQLAPVLQSMIENNDKTPNNALPMDTNGTVQSNNDDLPQIKTYNASGFLNKANPNSLIGIG